MRKVTLKPLPHLKRHIKLAGSEWDVFGKSENFLIIVAAGGGYVLKVKEKEIKWKD